MRFWSVSSFRPSASAGHKIQFGRPPGSIRRPSHLKGWRDLFVVPIRKRHSNFLTRTKNGLLTETELEKLKQRVPAFRDNPQGIAQLFRRLDADGDGKLTLDEYRKIATLRRPGQAIPPKELPRRPEAETPMEKPASTEGASKSAPSDSANLVHFEKKIRPLLVTQCYECHAADAKEIKGGLAVDTRAGLRKGGDSGPAVVPGDVKASLLIAAIRHEDGLEMPPKQKLSDEQIADFVKWIEAGAIDPRRSGGEVRLVHRS